MLNEINLNCDGSVCRVSFFLLQWCAWQQLVALWSPLLVESPVQRWQRRWSEFSPISWTCAGEFFSPWCSNWWDSLITGATTRRVPIPRRVCTLWPHGGAYGFLEMCSFQFRVQQSRSCLNIIHAVFHKWTGLLFDVTSTSWHVTRRRTTRACVKGATCHLQMLNSK